MTDRDHFAAAALTGLLCNGDYSMEAIPRHAFSMADAMLRERGNQPKRPDSSTPDADSRVWETQGHQRPTLTNEEREALHHVVGDVADITGPIEDTLRGLLERLG